MINLWGTSIDYTSCCHRRSPGWGQNIQKVRDLDRNKPGWREKSLKPKTSVWLKGFLPVLIDRKGTQEPSPGKARNACIQSF